MVVVKGRERIAVACQVILGSCVKIIIIIALFIDVLTVMKAKTAFISGLVASLANAYTLSPDKTPTGRLLPFPQHRIPQSEAVDHVNL